MVKCEDTLQYSLDPLQEKSVSVHRVRFFQAPGAWLQSIDILAAAKDIGSDFL